MNLPVVRALGTRARVTAALTSFLFAVSLLTGCGLFSETEESPADGPVEAVITHKFGETRVPADAERVVTVGWNDQDFVLALGVVPVATRAWYDEYNGFPWVTDATGGEKLPTLQGDGINFDSIAAKNPDVIFSIYESIDRKTYKRLAEIAPTVIQSDEYEDEETPWDVQLLTTGQALGKEDEAKALVAEVQGKIAAAKKQFPEFAGKALVADFGPSDGGHWLLGAGDPRRALFDALGFAAQNVSGDLSEEKLSELDRDVLFVNGATEDEMLASPAFARLDVVTEGRTLYTTFESNLSGALAYSGPEALLYALDVLVPELANALNGRPVADLSDA